MKYKGMIFDLDGTLADTIESIGTAGNKALEVCQLKPHPLEEYRYFAGDGADTLVRRALAAAGDTTGEHFDEAYREYKRFFEKSCTYKVKPFEGITEMLSEAKKQGIKLAVVSNKPHAAAIEVVETLFGAGFFDMIVGNREGIAKKPDPVGALEAAKKFGVSPEECMYIGDTDVDMQTGHRAGMYTVGVLWGFRSRQELEENHADRIVERPAELLEL
jgi:phosphoglycolate phosphatase